MSVLLSGGIGWRTLMIVAGFLHLLLYLGWVGWWGPLRDGDNLRPPVGNNMRWREGILDCGIRLPQCFLGSFAFQGASSSVLKPHLDRKERKKGV